MRSTTETIIDIIMVIRIECTAPLSALDLCFSPMYFDNAEVAPAPRPLPTPTSTRNIGVTYPTPASASAPNPATHAASARLYILISSMDIIKGTDIFLKPCLGSPRIVSTPLVVLLFLLLVSPVTLSNLLYNNQYNFLVLLCLSN